MSPAVFATSLCEKYEILNSSTVHDKFYTGSMSYLLYFFSLPFTLNFFPFSPTTLGYFLINYSCKAVSINTSIRWGICVSVSRILVRGYARNSLSATVVFRILTACMYTVDSFFIFLYFSLVLFSLAFFSLSISYTKCMLLLIVRLARAIDRWWIERVTISIWSTYEPVEPTRRWSHYALGWHYRRNISRP